MLVEAFRKPARLNAAKLLDLRVQNSHSGPFPKHMIPERHFNQLASRGIINRLGG
jgi:hypothetical protein